MKPGVKADEVANAPYGLNGAPAVYKNLVFTGSHLQDYGSFGGRGDVRAWDAATGKLVWTFHTVPQPGEPGHETWLDDGWKNRSGVNVWSTFTVDAQTGTLLMPIGGPSDDRYGGDRPGANLFGNSLVAVDAMTGKLKWYLQTVHHDLWDTDLPPQPTLVDVVKDGKKIPGVDSGRQDRPDIHSGSPDGKSHLRHGGAAGTERRCSRRVVFAHAAISVEAAAAGARDMEARRDHEVHSGTTEVLRRSVQERAERRSVCAGAHDGYGSVSRARMGASTGAAAATIPGWATISSTRTTGAQCRRWWRRFRPRSGRRGRSAGRAIRAKCRSCARPWDPITNPATGWPCQSPPWGELFAINVNTGDVAWRIPFGRVESLEKIGVMNTGSYNIGGSVATASGLLFIGATDDQRFHAYESKTGKLLWETKLPANAFANPITYLGKDGKQYVVIAAQETIVAFRLP